MDLRSLNAVNSITRRGPGLIRIAECLAIIGLLHSSAMAATDAPPARSVQVELPNQEHNAVKQSWPGIGCWFWTKEEFQPDGYKRFLDLHYKHSAFRLLTTSIRFPVEVTDPKVHEQIRLASVYARQRDMAIVMDLRRASGSRRLHEEVPE